uniref:Cilia- and flagella-associated protein 157 n=2 Tax=Homalodisca liturata TaxID=320908 RepID=A0A1B6I8Z0_9HEMI
MGKKGKGGGKKKQAKEDKEVLPEVDKEFYEIQITDLNQKLARLRSRCSELESENEDVKKSLQKLDEDRADIIAYLRRTLQSKADEIAELQERLVALQQTREAEKTAFQEKIKSMEHDFKSMHEQLNSEIKLLNGKLNSLEEFRREREELMNKFTRQEEEMEEQEKRHKIALYEVERKFIVGKDELKKDMENKLLQLSLDFQTTTDIRIATTTQRVIRENVAVNNEINVLMESWKGLHEENADLKKKERDLKIEAEIQREDNKILLKKNLIQNRIIEKISMMQMRLQDTLRAMEKVQWMNKVAEDKLIAAKKALHAEREISQRLKQLLEARDAEECQHVVDLHELRQHCRTLETMIETATEAVRQALNVQEEPDEDEAYNLSQRESLLSILLELFDKPELLTTEPIEPLQSIDTIIYTKGNLGLISKPEEDTKKIEEDRPDGSSTSIGSDNKEKDSDSITALSKAPKPKKSAQSTSSNTSKKHS